MRALRLPTLRQMRFRTADGAELLLENYAGGRRGAVVLAPGYSMSTRVFDLDTVETSLAEYLFERGHDVWLFGWRSCAGLAASRVPFTLDDVARHDWPAALEVVRQVSGFPHVDCVVHCIGAQTLLMALAGGATAGIVRSAFCLQVGLHYDQPLLTRLKARLHTAEVLELLGLRSLNQSEHVTGPAYRLLDAALALHPRDRRQRCRNATCRRANFVWGELLEHANVGEDTHGLMAELLGDVAVRGVAHLSRGIRAGAVRRADGADVYFDAPDRLRLPISFLHGSANLTMGAGSTRRTYDWLCARNGPELYRHHVVPGYGHMDSLIGRYAAQDVFPLIGRHLDDVEALARTTPPVRAGSAA